MPSIRFRLEKPTLTGLAAQVRAQYGPDARIVDTEERVIGGLGGFFGRRVVDVTVELPDEAPGGSHEFDMARRVGLAALLEDADARDFGPAAREEPLDLSAPPRPGDAGVSTQGGDFASVLDALRIDVEPASEHGGGTPARPLAPRTPARPAWSTEVATTPVPVVPRAPVRPLTPRVLEAAPVRTPRVSVPDPVAAEEFVWATPEPRSRMGRTPPGTPPPPRTRAGDLLLLVGLGDDAVRVAQSVRDRLQRGYVCDGGSVEGNTRRRVDDRRGALAARAYGVRSAQPVIVAYGLGDGDPADPRYAGLLTIDSDQAWLVVDSARRQDDTLAWTGRLRGRLQVDAVASLGGATSTVRSDTLAVLGLPEAWSDSDS